MSKSDIQYVAVGEVVHEPSPQQCYQKVGVIGVVTVLSLVLMGSMCPGPGRGPAAHLPSFLRGPLASQAERVNDCEGAKGCHGDHHHHHSGDHPHGHHHPHHHGHQPWHPPRDEHHGPPPDGPPPPPPHGGPHHDGPPPPPHHGKHHMGPPEIPDGPPPPPHGPHHEGPPDGPPPPPPLGSLSFFRGKPKGKIAPPHEEKMISWSEDFEEDTASSSSDSASHDSSSEDSESSSADSVSSDSSSEDSESSSADSASSDPSREGSESTSEDSESTSEDPPSADSVSNDDAIDNTSNASKMKSHPLAADKMDPKLVTSISVSQDDDDEVVAELVAMDGENFLAPGYFAEGLSSEETEPVMMMEDPELVAMDGENFLAPGYFAEGLSSEETEPVLIMEGPDFIAPMNQAALVEEALEEDSTSAIDVVRMEDDPDGE